MEHEYNKSATQGPVPKSEGTTTAVDRLAQKQLDRAREQGASEAAVKRLRNRLLPSERSSRPDVNTDQRDRTPADEEEDSDHEG
jgi:hypothetical protein